MAAHSISQPTFTESTTTGGATNVTYTIGFNTSSTGALSSTAGSQISLTGFPAGTDFSHVVADAIHNGSSTSAPQVGFCNEDNTAKTVTCFLNNGSIANSSPVTIEIDGVTNPPVSGPVSVSTTSDPSAVGSSQPGQGGPPPAPVVTTVNPTHGPAAGGTSVTITGSNLAGATGVSFGNNAASNVKPVGDTSITAITPAGSGTVPVTVSSPNGTSNNTVTYTYDALVQQQSPPPLQPPAVSQQTPAPASATSTDLSGAVNPNGQATTVHWEYGLDKAYRPPGFTGNCL